MSNLNNFNDIYKYINSCIEKVQIPKSISGVIKYAGPFNPTEAVTIYPIYGDIWFNTSTNVYYKYTTSWLSQGEVKFSKGNYLYTDNYYETAESGNNTYQAELIYCNNLGSETLYWKIVRDKFFEPDYSSINLNSSGKVQLSTELLRNINKLSVSNNGHSKGFLRLSSGSDSVDIVDDSSFLKLSTNTTQVINPNGTNSYPLRIKISDIDCKLDFKSLPGIDKDGRDTTYEGLFLMGDAESEPYGGVTLSDSYIRIISDGGLYIVNSTGNPTGFVFEGACLRPVRGSATESEYYLGSNDSKFTTLYCNKLNNGGDINIPTSSGTLALTSQIPSTLRNPYAVTIKLNGGTTEGTNLFTYNGSSAKTINITPSSIGASASSHTHSYLSLSGGTLTGNVNIKSSKKLNFYNSSDSVIGWIAEQGDGRLHINGGSSLLRIGTNSVEIDINEGVGNDTNDQGSISPVKNTTNLGSTTYPWRTVYAGSGVFSGNIKAQIMTCNGKAVSVEGHNHNGSYLRVESFSNGVLKLVL